LTTFKCVELTPPAGFTRVLAHPTPAGRQFVLIEHCVCSCSKRTTVCRIFSCQRARALAYAAARLSCWPTVPVGLAGRPCWPTLPVRLARPTSPGRLGASNCRGFQCGGGIEEERLRNRLTTHRALHINQRQLLCSCLF